MVDPAAIRAVVFDMGGVFLIPHPDPIAETLAAAGVDHVPSPDEVHRAHYRGVRAITDLLATETAVDELDPDVWGHYDRGYYGALGLDEDLIALASAARSRQRRSGAGGVWRHLLADNVAAFARIARRFAVAIVSNNDGTAAAQCAEHGIAQVGDGPHTAVAAIVDSTEVGIAKPDPRIFRPALEALEVEPGEALYVGDTVHADVEGARAAGMPVVQLDPYELHADHDHWRAPDVVALADALGA